MRFLPKIAAIAVLMITSASPALAEDLEFTLTNKSGSAITAFHVSHEGTSEWENNLLEGAYLPDGNEISVLINDGRDVCTYDILTEFEDGDSVEDYGLNLCDMGSYTFE
jgi:hypothetical protein